MESLTIERRIIIPLPEFSAPAAGLTAPPKCNSDADHAFRIAFARTLLLRGSRNVLSSNSAVKV